MLDSGGGPDQCLESLTKELPSNIAVSEEIYQRIPPEMQARLTYLEKHDLKGKSDQVPVYGCVSEND